MPVHFVILFFFWICGKQTRTKHGFACHNKTMGEKSDGQKRTRRSIYTLYTMRRRPEIKYMHIHLYMCVSESFIRATKYIYVRESLSFNTAFIANYVIYVYILLSLLLPWTLIAFAYLRTVNNIIYIALEQIMRCSPTISKLRKIVITISAWEKFTPIALHRACTSTSNVQLIYDDEMRWILICIHNSNNHNGMLYNNIYIVLILMHSN